MRKPKGYDGMSRRERELIEDGLPIMFDQIRGDKRSVSKKDGVSEEFAHESSNRAALGGNIGQNLMNQLVEWTITRATRYADGSRLSKADHRKINRNWPDFINHINSELLRLQRRLNVPERYLFTTEINPGHWKNYNELFLHTHGIFCNQWDKEAGSYVITKEMTDDIVRRGYSNLLGKEVDITSCCRSDTISGLDRMVNYYSKMKRVARYLSKGSELLKEIRKTEPPCIKGMAWVSCDKETRQLARSSVHQETFDVDIKTLKEIVEDINIEHKKKTGKPLFSDPWELIKPDVPYACSVLFQVKDTRNIGYAMNLLLTRLHDPEDTG